LGSHLLEDLLTGATLDDQVGNGFGILGRRRWGEFVGFVMGFEKAVFPVEGAFGGVFVAEHEVVHFALGGGPHVRRVAGGGGDEFVVLALDAEAVPLGLGGAENEIGFERCFEGLVGVLPARQEDEPALFGFHREDEGSGASAVFAGVLCGGGATLG
jgi:hypothetical protein